MKLTQLIAASISSGAAVLLLSAALISQAAPVPVTRASLEEALEPRGALNTISEVLDGVRSSHIDDVVKTSSLDEILFGSSVPRRANARETKKRQAPAGVQPAQPLWPSLHLADFEKEKSLRRQQQIREGNKRYRMRKQDVKGVEKGLYKLKDLEAAQVLRLPGPEAKSKNPVALASRERRRLERARREADMTAQSFSRPPPEPVMTVRVKRKPGGQVLDDGADEETLKKRQMHREAMRRYRVRAKAFKDIETFKDIEVRQRVAEYLIAVPEKLTAGRKVVLNTPEAERNRERVRATRRRKKEAKANAESQVNTSEPISTTRIITSTSSKRRKVQSSTAPPEGARQEALEADFKVPDLNLPPTEFY